MINMPAIDMARTGQRIADLREQAGLSVRDLQQIFGFATPQAIYKWQGGMALPTIDNLVVLAAVLQVTLEDILVIDTNSNSSKRLSKCVRATSRTCMMPDK